MESIKNVAENTEVEKLLNKYNWKIISILSEGSLYQLKNENYFPDYYYIELYLTQNTLASFTEEFIDYLKNFNAAEEFYEEVPGDTDARNYFNKVHRLVDFWESVGKEHKALAKELRTTMRQNKEKKLNYGKEKF